MSDMERLELFEKLEKAEGRIVALEKQVKHSAALFHFLEVWRFAYLTCLKVVKVFFY